MGSEGARRLWGSTAQARGPSPGPSPAHPLRATETEAQGCWPTQPPVWTSGLALPPSGPHWQSLPCEKTAGIGSREGQAGWELACSQSAEPADKEQLCGLGQDWGWMGWRGWRRHTTLGQEAGPAHCPPSLCQHSVTPSQRVTQGTTSPPEAPWLCGCGQVTATL